jgi:hypothetical protein
MPRVYNLYLSTQVTSPAGNFIVPLNITAKNNAQWMVDFKSLFGEDARKYRRCQVRFHLTSESWVSAGTDWQNYSGYLAVSLPSMFQSNTTIGTVLGLVNPSDTPTPESASCYNVSTLGNQVAADINMPADNQLVNIRFCSDDSMSLMASTLPNYQILLSFELSEPIAGEP